MAALTSSLVVRLLDQVTAPARSVSKSLLGIQDAANKRSHVLRRSAAGRDRCE